jgi:hypothetical protein
LFLYHYTNGKTIRAEEIEFKKALQKMKADRIHGFLDVKKNLYHPENIQLKTKHRAYKTTCNDYKIVLN